MNSTPLSFWQKLKRRKLRNYLVLDKKLQWNFAILLAIVGVFNAAYFTALMYFYTRELFFRLTAFIPDYLLTDDLLKENYRLFVMTVIFTIVAEAIFIGLLGLFFSHRIAGPLYAMSQKLQVISRGAIPQQVRLRKNDLLTGFAETMNETISVLESQRTDLATALKDLQEGRSRDCEEKLRKLTEPAPAPGPSSPDAAPPQG
jgi:methyl-accepting chemotaxis protein